MNFEVTTLIGLGTLYLALLFGIAYITERKWIPVWLVHSPFVYVLSLGVFASVWAYYTSIGVALREGYGYLASSIGISLAFLFSPLLLRPILNLTKTYQLSSLADLMAFRYRSPWAGICTTLLTLVGVTPLISLQIRAVADTASLISSEATQDNVAFGFCLVITLFAILFGTSRRAGRTQHDGLIMAIAFESLVKLLAFLCVGLFAIYSGFGGFEAMESWLLTQPNLQERLRETDYLSSFHVISLMFFTAAVAMPHMFYATFNENKGARVLSIASWGLPLYFLVISLPVLPILWAGINSGSTAQVEYYPVILGIEGQSSFFTLLAYLGGLSAASGLIIVITLAMSNMCLNHLILPIFQPAANQDIYRWLLWKRRVLITALIWAGFLFHSLPERNLSLEAIGIVAFTSGLNFLPGIVAILYWPHGNKKGYLSGLAAGAFIWFVFLMLPLFSESASQPLIDFNWQQIAMLSLIANTIVFISTSLLNRSSDEERSSADICTLDTIQRRKRSGLVARSPGEFIKSLSKPLGPASARREVELALADLSLTLDDRRPFAMRLLRGRLEANLSGLLGPSIAREIIDGYLPYSNVSGHGSTDLNIMENRIESYRSNLSGLAADLDNLRRYHRQILLDLPLGVCSLSTDGEITMWNRALEKFTGIEYGAVIGSQLNDIADPWRTLMIEFIAEDSFHHYKKQFELNNSRHTVNLHKAEIEQTAAPGVTSEGLIILIEDITEIEVLEAGLTHNERLASIGRLAAGVAHEIGNPVTGIACLAQTIRDEYDSGELRNLAGQIIEQTDRTGKILHSLVNFAHAGSNQSANDFQPVNVAICMEEARTLVSLDKKSREVEIDIHCPSDLEIAGDSQRLLQVFVNLINNARDASQPDSLVRLEGRSSGHDVIITVTDQGIGIPPAIRDRVFDPFFTTKEAGEGTGLGLSLVFSIIRDMNGEIDIISPVDEARGTGTQVRIRFPELDSNQSRWVED